MHNLDTQLETCFNILSQEFEIEKVDYILENGKERKISIPVWRIVIQAEYNGIATDVEIFMTFPKGFPYVLPGIIIPDERFRFLPHISYRNAKLCIYEDEIVYDASDIYGIIRTTLKKVRLWIEKYSNQDNTAEYLSEIKQYWQETFDKENEVDNSSIFFGDIPRQSCNIKGIMYYKTNSKDGSKYIQTIYYLENDPIEILHLKKFHKTAEISALFLSNIDFPTNPPFALTVLDFIKSITNSDDKKVFQRFINTNEKGHILFPIGLNQALGGVIVDKLNTKRKGFRKGALHPFDILTRFENKNKYLKRITSNIYNCNRIATRTSGNLMEKRCFFIAGLGSIGSNLCYYLNGYNNAQFTLVDTDYLSTDNIGRHLLGFEYINQNKAYSVASYLKSYRPDREVQVICNNLQTIPIIDINKESAVFICTGDSMSEQWLIEKMIKKEIIVPVFILWLEPYGISGLMMYLNPDDEESLMRMQTYSYNRFLDYCLIDSSEYDKGDKLIKKDVGCNGKYAQYSANDVILFLSAIFPYIDKIITTASKSKCYQWIGNIEIAKQKNIQLCEGVSCLKKNELRILSI